MPEIAGKPLGIIIIAAAEILAGIYAMILTIYLILIAVYAQSAEIDRLYLLMLILVGFGTGFIGIYIAKGLLELKYWARNTSIVLLALLFLTSAGGAINGNIASILIMFVSISFIVYLIRKETGAVFSESCEVK
jgi:hypothetical protein